MIKELISKDKEREKEAYVYSNEGIKTEIMDIQEKFTASCQENIYQKAEKIDFSFWYGEVGLMKKMLLKE